MAGLVSNLLLLTLQYVALDCTKQTSRWVYKPYGIEMCRALCLDSPDIFYYLQEDLSCRRVSTNDSTGSINVSPQQCLMEDRRVNPATAFPFPTGLTVCNEEARSTVDQVSVQYNFNMTLQQACQDGRLDVVKYILSQGLEDINSRGKRQRTPVMVAALKGQVAVFDYLVSQGCDLSAVDDSENNVLHAACYGGNSDIVRKLIVDKTCDIERSGRYGRKPVMWAVFRGHREVFELLVGDGCDLNALDDNKNTILHLACVGGNSDIVRKLTDTKNCDIERRARYGTRPVMCAAYCGHRDVVELLAGKGCNLTAVDDLKCNILHLACKGGHVNMVRYLLSQNVVSIESRDKNGRTPVMLAAVNGRKCVLEYLVERGCNLTAVDNRKGNILHCACNGGHVDMVGYIISKNVFSTESRDKEGRTSVMEAAASGQKGVFDFLVARGCNLTAVDYKKDSVLHLSCYFGHADIVKYILSQEIISIESRGYRGKTPVLMAVHGGHMDIFDILDSKDCNLMAVDDHKNNILHFACIRGQVDIVKYLMTLGGGQGMEKVRNKYGYTPVQMAERHGHVAAVSLFN